MANTETLRWRARIAAWFSHDMRVPSFYRKATELLPTDSQGEYSIIVATPEESAAVTMHRMELLGEKNVIIVTVIDDAISATAFANEHDDKGRLKVFDIANGLTVKEWIEAAAKLGSEYAHNISGTEFAEELAGNPMLAN